MGKFQLATHMQPKGDQPGAISSLVKGVRTGKKHQVLLGVTGSGKTFTMAHVVQEIQKPTLVLAHNKTLAAQLYQEFKGFFPYNAVEYFVSYYDYYQPEAYIARTDTYIEKDLAINDRIEKMRLSATRSLLEREDVLIVSSVSCIYGLGLPEYYAKMKLDLEVGKSYLRDGLLLHLIYMHYKRNDYDLSRGTFRVRGDILDIIPAYEEEIAYRIEFFDEVIERISVIDPLIGKTMHKVPHITIYPGSHYVTPAAIREKAIETIREELQERIAYFESQEKWVEKQRIEQRTTYDMELMKEVGTCKGIENYSRHFSSRAMGEPPPCLLDYFPSDFLLFIDESHQTIPQIHAMYNGDRARKKSLVEFGFRLPSAFDNRPLNWDEFFTRIKGIGGTIYVSATPGSWEIEQANGEIVQQIIRPTGLLDPLIEVRPTQFQFDNCLDQIRQTITKNGRILITTLTKRLAEELTRYLHEFTIKAAYLHAEIDTLQRMEIINDLRNGTYDVLVGINLLREGLDLPEVSLVVILDADKEGFLRSTTSLIQICGRAARNVDGRVILYADQLTQSIKETIAITNERRTIQEAYNRKHHITPRTVEKKTVQDLVETFFGYSLEKEKKKESNKPNKKVLSMQEIEKKILECETAMKKSAKAFHFEEAAAWRDQLRFYKEMQLLQDDI